jgi:hypothetical protein
VPTFEECKLFSVQEQLQYLEQTPRELELLLSGKSDAELSNRPLPNKWSAKEIVCHLRDVEELFQMRFHTIVALEEPYILLLGATPKDLETWKFGGALGPHSTLTGGLKSGSIFVTIRSRHSQLFNVVALRS